jgi:hypothetical protein
MREPQPAESSEFTRTESCEINCHCQSLHGEKFGKIEFKRNPARLEAARNDLLRNRLVPMGRKPGMTSYGVSRIVSIVSLLRRRPRSPENVEWVTEFTDRRSKAVTVERIAAREKIARHEMSVDNSTTRKRTWNRLPAT